MVKYAHICSKFACCVGNVTVRYIEFISKDFHAASHKFYSLLNEAENMGALDDRFNVSSCIICSCLVYLFLSCLHY